METRLKIPIFMEVDIGADEVYACHDAGNDDIYNPFDWNADGAVNYGEIMIFSRAWLSCDPNVYPGTDPNVWDVWMQWGRRCDLYDDERVDLLDLEIFLEAPWLWEACWRTEVWQMQTMMMGGGGGMMSKSSLMETLYSAQSLQAESVQQSEPTQAELAENIVLILDFLEEVLGEDNPENEGGILEIKAVLEDWFEEINLE